MQFNCGVCGYNSSLAVFEGVDFDSGNTAYSLRRCARCAVVQISPMPSVQTLNKAYSLDYYGGENQKFAGIVEWWTQFAARNRAVNLVGEGKHSAKKILDYGCGRGVLLNGLKSIGHIAIGVEREGFNTDNKDILTGDEDSFPFCVEEFDAAVLWHVLEHLRNPAKTLGYINSILKKDGMFYVSVPNFGSVQSKLFRSYWFHLDLPRHLYHFEYGALENALDRCGFEVNKVSTFSFDQNLYGFIQSALNVILPVSQNHLYKLLYSGLSFKKGVLLLCYFPLVVLLGVVGVFEMVLAGVLSRGAVLTVEVKKK